ncbi:MAG: PKD domain-containing protein [Bacteroidales bacterium]
MKKALLLSASFIFILVQTYAQSAYFTSDSPRCLNNTVNFTPGPPGGIILTEEWNFGDGTVNTYLPPVSFPVYATHAYANPGNYTVTRTVTFTTGPLSFNILVHIVAPPFANFMADPAYLGTPTTFTDLSVAFSGFIVSWLWEFGDGQTSNLNNPTHFYGSVGTYMARLAVTNNYGCTKDTLKPVTVMPAGINPPATQTITDIVVSSGQSRCYNATQSITVAGNGTIFNDQPGGEVTFIAGQQISFLPGTTVQSGGLMRGIIAPSGPYCQNPSMPSVVATGEEIPMVINQTFLKIYPNPATDKFTLELNEGTTTGKTTVDVYGIPGVKLMTTILNEERKHEFPVAGMPAGIYFIRVVSGEKSETARILKR